MAISKTQPMRPAEIGLVELANQLETDLNAAELAITAETSSRESADTQLGNRINTEKLTRESNVASLDLRVTANEGSIESLQLAVSAIPVFDYGSEEVTVAAQTTQSGRVTFEMEKEAVPFIITSLITDQETWANSQPAIETYDVSTEGFGYTVSNSATTSVDFLVNWLTIGV